MSNHKKIKKLKKLPKFKNEDEEREFWDKADSTEYFDWSKAKRVKFPNLKPSTETISLRLPLGLLEDIKIQANKRDIPYQSYIKTILHDSINAQ
jgi:predicted DNA binding CopG/RHH family protein